LEEKISMLQSQLNMLPIQMQSIIIEQNKLVLDKFQVVHKQNSFSYSGANSIDGGDGSASNIMASSTATNILQVPTISTNTNR
jgi:hypothetical protein